MSTQPPDLISMTTSKKDTTMAVAQSQPKSLSKANVSSASRGKLRMHRRSRTGCYTCRLRRKKCDEGSPACTACKHLGLSCEYKRPLWWGNNEQRRSQKDDIKKIIKSKKHDRCIGGPSRHHHHHHHHHYHHKFLASGDETPPGLSHSLPTSATFSDPLDRTRSASIESQYSFLLDFSSPPPHVAQHTAYNAHLHSSHSQHVSTDPEFLPFEIDVKTERQMFIDEIPTRRESTISTFSGTLHPPPPPPPPPLSGTVLPPTSGSGEWESMVYSERCESLTEDTLNVANNLFDFPAHHDPGMATGQLAIELDKRDQRLLDHFVAEVLPTIFPILETNQHGSVRTDYVLPALRNNRCYLHCCLSIAAQHYKATSDIRADQIDNDIMRHRYATISELCAALNRDMDHTEILEATLGMIVFQCSVGRFDDALPDIPWHQHFQAAISLVQKLELHRIVLESPKLISFNITLTAWIDILGSTMQGRAPTFAHLYREKHLSDTHTSLGLRELMGCEDHVLYLVSEITCLEALKRDGMNEIQLCHHVEALGEQINLTEIGEVCPMIPFDAHGVLSPRQLSKNITAAFRIAARIYLCSLVPNFAPTQDSCVGLIKKLMQILNLIPSGPAGFDRSLVWVYLIAGSVSTATSPFRSLFAERLAQLGELAQIGSLGRVACLLREVWHHMDSRVAPGGGDMHYISWRDVMQMKGWDFLLI